MRISRTQTSRHRHQSAVIQAEAGVGQVLNMRVVVDGGGKLSKLSEDSSTYTLKRGLGDVSD